MAEPQSNADQIAFWNGDAGAKWVQAQDRLDAMLRVFSDEVMRVAKPAAGERILDIGCGCGDTSLQLAAKGATVTGVDISAPMLARARQRAKEADARHVEFLEADAAQNRFEPSYDVLFSRFGVMFFANPDAAFANLRKALKPSGRLAFVCWRDPRENEWVRVPVGAVRPHAPPQPQLGPEDPGPFAFADLARLRRVLANGGFDRITVRPFDADVRLGDTFDDAVAYIQEFGPISRMLTDATPAQKAAAGAAIREAFKPYADRKPLTMGGAVWIVTAAAS
jgi:SAM-dependent methyltransferase